MEIELAVLGILATVMICEAVAELVSFFVVKMKNRMKYPLADFEPMGGDQAIIDQLADSINGHLGANAGVKLMEMDLESRKEALSWLAQENARIMGIADMPEIEFLESGELGENGARTQGRFVFAVNKLQINLDYLKIQNEKVLLDALDTVVHEMCHAYQYMKMEEMLERLEEVQAEEEREAMASDPEDMRTIFWLKNEMPGNYILFHVDPEGYRRQPVESYAFGMANAVMRKLWEGTDEQ